MFNQFLRRFQFHKVRLKEKVPIVPFVVVIAFQFHKVRLKVYTNRIEHNHYIRFNSIRYD